MGKVFKQPTTHYSLDGKRCPKGTPGAASSRVLSRDWYGNVGEKKVRLCPDKRAAEQMLRKLLSDVALEGVGLSDPFAAHKRTPLADHLSDYASHLTAKRDSPRHIAHTVARVRAVLIDGCNFTRLPDVTVTPVNDWLAKIGRDAAPVAVPPGTEFTPAQVSALLGVSPQAVSESIRRLRLPATGNTKARRLPRASVEQLVAGRSRGASPQPRRSTTTSGRYGGSCGGW